MRMLTASDRMLSGGIGVTAGRIQRGPDQDEETADQGEETAEEDEKTAVLGEETADQHEQADRSVYRAEATGLLLERYRRGAVHMEDIPDHRTAPRRGAVR